MLESLKQAVWEANLELSRRGLAPYTWGNVSGIDRDAGLFAIKPSGVAYDRLRPEDMVLVDLEGRKVEGPWNPSTDTPTHLELYRAFPAIGGVAHTHSPEATAFAQAGMAIPAYGTTHADYFGPVIPCARPLSPQEVAENYEGNTGLVIAETFRDLDPAGTPAVLLTGHGPFTWGKDAAQAVFHAAVLEDVAHMARLTRQLRPDAPPLAEHVRLKHYLRKHGAGAYYGQGSAST